MESTTNSDSSPHFPLDEEDGYHQHQSPSRPWHRILKNLGLMSLRRRRYSYAPAVADPSDYGKGRYQSYAPSLWPRWAKIRSLAKNACLAMPFLVLMLFGVFHILEVFIGRASLVWDIDHDNFLPHWGQQGHIGEGLAHYPTDVTRDVLPVPVHSHNDYWRRIPLFEALHYGCMGVEADVWLFDDDLFVGHNTASLTRNRTFRSLYVNPLANLLEKMNPHTEFGNASRHGVFDVDHEQTLVLLVDLKTDGRKTLPAVEEQLEPLRSGGYLTYFNGTDVIPSAITVVGTGNTPFDMLVANTTFRDIFFDAPLDRLWEKSKSWVLPSESANRAALGANADHGAATANRGLVPSDRHKREEGMNGAGQGSSGLAANTPASVFNSETSYYASVDFYQAVGFVWRGHLSPRQLDIIRGQIRGAKRRGLKARYWNTPVWPISLRNHVWHVLVKEGADILNADDLAAAARQDWTRWRHEWW